MDDGASIDLLDLPPIGSPDHSQITIKQKRIEGELHSGDETEDAANISVDSEYHRGSPRLLPHPRSGFRRCKPLSLDTTHTPPLLHSPDYPSTTEGTPSPLSCTSDYLYLDDNSPLQPTKFDDNTRFHRYPNILIYVRRSLC